MHTQRLTGILLLAGAAAGVLIPYSILTGTFHYPDILREDTSIILTKFHEGGSSLIFTWLAFALAGLPLLPAYILIGRMDAGKSPLLKIATNIGLIGLIVQLIGLLRWVFVVPVLADSYFNTPDESTRAAAIIAFKTIHQFAGVLLGEHLGQLFTVTWTIMISIYIYRNRLMPRWISVLGMLSGLIYFLSQLELLATVIPGMPVWELAGFMGSTLWLIWLTIIGVTFLRKNKFA